MGKGRKNSFFSYMEFMYCLLSASAITQLLSVLGIYFFLIFPFCLLHLCMCNLPQLFKINDEYDFFFLISLIDLPSLYFTFFLVSFFLLATILVALLNLQP